MAEFEFQIDELLHKLDVISGVAAPFSSSAPPPQHLSSNAAFNNQSSTSGVETKDSSGVNSKSGTSSDQRQQQQHLQQHQQQHLVSSALNYGVDDPLAYDPNHDWTQLVDLNNFEAGLVANDDDKVRRRSELFKMKERKKKR